MNVDCDLWSLPAAEAESVRRSSSRSEMDVHMDQTAAAGHARKASAQVNFSPVEPSVASTDQRGANNSKQCGGLAAEEVSRSIGQTDNYCPGRGRLQQMHISAERGRYEEFLSKVAAALELKMSQSQQTKVGTGPGDVFDILVKTPPERLLSVTLQRSESPEGNVIHVLCLIVLQRDRQALSMLHALDDCCLSRHLAEAWLASRGELEDFAARFARFQSLSLDSLVLLARVFKVLSEQRLCDAGLRDAAYRRALAANDEGAPGDLGYEQLREEAVAVCGPHVADRAPSDARGPGSLCALESGREDGSAPPTGRSDGARGLPSPLLANSSMLTYPSHLEISIAPTNLVAEDRRSAGAPSTADASVLRVSEVDAKGVPPPPEDAQFRSSDGLVPPSIPASTPTTGPSISAPSTYAAADAPSPGALEDVYVSEEEEATFYAFVIMHAPEDADVADGLRERMEKLVVGCRGATFSEDFCVPGRSTLRCVEDSINNTAFTFLLLTRNFTTRMLEMETESALINSLQKKHKWNTVIPLLPQHNCMHRNDMPLVLRTIVPLEENKNFERKIVKSLSLAKIKRQEKMWMDEQRVKIQKARLEQLKYQKKLMKEREKAQWREKENLGLRFGQKLVLSPNGLGEDDEDISPWLPKHPNIHIENANYIMIGNDSQMTVGVARGVDKDHSNHGEEEP